MPPQKQHSCAAGRPLNPGSPPAVPHPQAASVCSAVESQASLGTVRDRHSGESGRTKGLFTLVTHSRIFDVGVKI